MRAEQRPARRWRACGQERKASITGPGGTICLGAEGESAVVTCGRLRLRLRLKGRFGLAICSAASAPQ